MKVLRVVLPGSRFERLVDQLLHPKLHLLDAEGKIMPREVFRSSTDPERPGAIEVMFDGLRPLLVRGHAYDAAVANYLEFLHHLEDELPAVKYHLRPLDDGVRLLKALDARALNRPEPPLYEELFDQKDPFKDSPEMRQQRLQHLELLLGKGLGPRLERWQVAMDISARLRLLHKNNRLNDETANQAFRPLAELIAGGDKANWEKYLPQARKHYNRRALEFHLHNILVTSSERIFEWVSLDPKDANRSPDLFLHVDEAVVRQQIGLSPEEWAKVRDQIAKNFADMARLQLVYSLREIGLADQAAVMEIYRRTGVLKAGGAENLVRFQQLFKEAQSPWRFHWGRLKDAPVVYLEIYARRGAKAVAGFAKQRYLKFEDELLTQVGWNNGEPVKLFAELGHEQFNTRVNEYFNATGVEGFTRRFVRNTARGLFDKGRADSILGIARTFSESGGDLDKTRKAMQDELIGLVPLIGPAYQFVQADSYWGKGLVLLPILVPELGPVVLAYNIGEKGLALVELEYAAPLRNSIADAIYRGYVGPSLYYYDAKPQEFTAEDAALLERVQNAIEDIKAKQREKDPLLDVRGIDGLPESLKLPPPLQKQLAEVQQREKALLLKKSAWDAFSEDQRRYEGGQLLQLLADLYPSLENVFRNGHPSQKRLKLGDATDGDPQLRDSPLYQAGPLLASIEPVVFYSPGKKIVEVPDGKGGKQKMEVALGPVDFTVPPLTPEEEQKLKDLPALIQAATGYEKLAAFESELEKLAEQKEMFERAKRYLEQAEQNPELMHQIRRDSMYPALLLRKRDIRDFREKFVHDWIIARRKVLPDALNAVGVKVGERTPDAAQDQLRERLTQDLIRSRDLWKAWQYSVALRKEQAKQRAESRQVADLVDTLMEEAVEPKPGTAAVAAAIAQRHVPFAPPKVRVSYRKVPTDKPGVVEYRPDVSVTANPDIYKPPYSSVTYALSPRQAQQAAGNRSLNDLPLNDAVAKRLADYGKSKSTGGDPALVTFVFCDGVEYPNRLVPETTAELPVLQQVTHPQTGKPAHLFGSAGQAPEAAGEAVIVFRGTDSDMLEVEQSMSFQAALKVKGASLPARTPLHMIVSTGTYTKHTWWFWNQGLDGATNTDQSAWGGDTLAFRPEGYTLTVSVEGGGFSARRTFKLVLSEKVRKSVEANLKQADEFMKSGIIEDTKLLEGAREGKKRVEKDLEDLPKVEFLGTLPQEVARAERRKELMAGRERCQCEIDLYEKSVIPKRPVQTALARAKTVGDWSAVPGLTERLHELSKLDYELRIKKWQIGHDAWLASRQNDGTPAARKTAEEAAAYIARWKKEFADSEQGWVESVVFAQYEAYFQTGNWQAIIAAGEPKANTLQSLNWAGIHVFANLRKEAAAIYLRNFKTPKDREGLRKNLPPWWPEGDDDPLAAEKKK